MFSYLLARIKFCRSLECKRTIAGLLLFDLHSMSSCGYIFYYRTRHFNFMSLERVLWGPTARSSAEEDTVYL